MLLVALVQQLVLLPQEPAALVVAEWQPSKLVEHVVDGAFAADDDVVAFDWLAKQLATRDAVVVVAVVA